MAGENGAANGRAKQDPKGNPGPMPLKYRLYDKIKLSVHTVDLIITICVILLVVCLWIGVAMR